MKTRFEENIANKKISLGTVITLSDLCVSELAGDCGMDFCWIDAIDRVWIFSNSRVRSMCMNASDPIFISRDGKEEMVLLNIALYNHLFARAEVYRKLDEGERDVAEGRESDAFAMLERLGMERRV